MNKQYFMYLLAVMMVVMVGVGIASCSSDNDDSETPETTPFKVKDLVGTWGLIHSEGWEELEGHSERIKDDFDPENPTSEDATKMMITNPSGNTLEIVQYEWDELKKEWVVGYSKTAELNANKLIGAQMTILSVDARQLVVSVFDGLSYFELTYKRMN